MSYLFFSISERRLMIEEAIVEARAHTAARSNRNEVVAQNLKKRKHNSNNIMKLFKKASASSIKVGTAQLQYEDMVRRVEKKLSEKERMSLAATQNNEEKAAAIAKELFHIPGSLLTKQEVAHMWQASGCQDVLQQADCTLPSLLEFRSQDGTCNNLENPLFGAAGITFRRLAQAHYEDGVSSLRGNLQNRFFDFIPTGSFLPPYPSARYISTTVVDDRDVEELPFTHILMQWGQFLDHDLDLSPELEAECESCIFTDVCEPVRVPPSDPAFGEGTLNDGDCLRFSRSLPGCPMDPPGSFSPREQINDITSYIDGSMVYGSSGEVGAALREFKGGLLRTGPNFPGRLPSLPLIGPETARFIACPNRTDCFLCGDARCNEQISLSIMHTIWLREHNRCAREIAIINPHWDDERLYQECRMIIGALIQKITYEDYLPKVLGPANFQQFVGPYLGYNPGVDATVPNAFATAAYRYGHSLIRPFFDRLTTDFTPLSIGPLNLVNAFFNPDQFRLSLGTDPIARGLINTNSLRMDEFLNSVLTTQLFQTPASPGFDLASLNIQRGRDHGLPPYPIWRNFCNRIFKVTSPFENLITSVRFITTYGSLDTVDLWIGGLAEDRLPESLLGATFACIFGLTFANVRNGDRFYYERPGIFTPTQLTGIRQDTLSRVLCDNLDDLRTVQPDAFLSNQTRIRCSNIPRLNLNAFKEEPCYFRVGVAPRSFVTQVIALNQDIVRFKVTTSTFPPSTSPQFQCQVMQCPTSIDAADVIIFSNADRFDSTTLTSNSQLPRTSFGGPAYVASWDRYTFDAGLGGVFTSRSACEGSSATALEFAYGGRSVEAQGDDVGKHIPNELWGLIKDNKPSGTAKSSSSTAVLEEEEKKGSKAEVMSDEALVQELENALKGMS